jgi:hypothetical protein
MELENLENYAKELKIIPRVEIKVGGPWVHWRDI